MSSGFRSRARTRLEQDLNSKQFGSLLKALRLREPFLRRFETWAEVLKFMRVGTSDDPRKDKVLRPLFQLYEVNKDPRCLHVFFVIFWPALESIHYRKRQWDEDQEAHWSNVTWVFTRAVERLNTQRRTSRLVQKIYNDMVHDLWELYQRRWRQSECEIPLPPMEIELLGGTGDGIDFEAICLRQAHEQLVQRVRGCHKAGIITDTDLMLLLGQLLYGQSIREYAKDAGISYETGKKRRQRAWAKVPKVEE